MVLDGERCGRLASHGLSANLMIARQENVQDSRSHFFPILVKLFALWWQMLVQTSDITVPRSQIAKACAHWRRPDRAAVCFAATLDIYAVRSLFCLFALWRTPTRHHSTSLELQLPIPGSCCRRPRLFCCQTNVRLAKTNVCDHFKRTFTECSARFVSPCYLLRQPLATVIY